MVSIVGFSRPSFAVADVDTSVLVPTLSNLEAGLRDLESRLGDADAVGVALFRVQNDLARRRAIEKKRSGCETPWLIDLAARARALGPALRAHVQSARTAWVKVRRDMAAPSVEILLDDSVRARADSIRTRIEIHERRYLEASSWHASVVESVLRRCDVKLTAAPGLRAHPNPLSDELDAEAAASAAAEVAASEAAAAEKAAAEKAEAEKAEAEKAEAEKAEAGKAEAGKAATDKAAPEGDAEGKSTQGPADGDGADDDDANKDQHAAENGVAQGEGHDESDVAGPSNEGAPDGEPANRPSDEPGEAKQGGEEGTEGETAAAEPVRAASPTGPVSTGPVAVIVADSGMVCPLGSNGPGVFVIRSGEACYEKGPVCLCSPVPVLPATVFGTQRATASTL